MLTSNDDLKRKSIELSLKVINSQSRFPRRFIYIDECYEYFKSLDEVLHKTGLTPASFWHSVDYKNGVIWDPTASVMFTNCKGMILNESTATGVIRRYNKSS